MLRETKETPQRLTLQLLCLSSSTVNVNYFGICAQADVTQRLYADENDNRPPPGSRNGYSHVSGGGYYDSQQPSALIVLLLLDEELLLAPPQGRSLQPRALQDIYERVPASVTYAFHYLPVRAATCSPINCFSANVPAQPRI